MSRVRSRDTVPELLLRRALHRRGLRYRLHAELPGTPDIVFPRQKVAVFVDGDMWHGEGWRERGFRSMEEQFSNHRNPEFWIAKIRKNVQHDQDVNHALVGLGWAVHRVRESEVRGDLVSVVDEVEALVRRR